MMKALSEAKPKPEPKLQTPKPEPKSQKPKPEPKSQKPKPEISVNRRKLEKLRKDFDELRHQFSKKEIDRYRKSIYNVKNYKNLSISEIKEAGKSLNKFKKV